ncbi:MAG: 4-hydroxy-2-oxovalerate aldolase [Anaerolineae bacterium]|nr:4-hydroxy-2-oxovalerate aldolase [Anaerolineae bacterium]
MQNNLKRVLKQGGVAVGATILECPRPAVAKVLGLAGFDFLFLEYEHAYFNEENMAALILAARDSNLPTVVKVPSLHRHFISRALDAGALGIQLPRTNSAADVRAMVQYAKFPPLGDRAGCPGLANTDFRPVAAEEFFRSGNEETLIVGHIETQEGLDNLDEILDVPGLDAIFIGPYDLSAALGLPGQVTHPRLLDAAQRVIDGARTHGIAAGIYVGDVESGQLWIEKGMQLIETVSELSMIYARGSELMTQFRALTHKSAKVMPV